MLSLIRLHGRRFCAVLAAAGMEGGSTSTVYASYIFRSGEDWEEEEGERINSRRELLVRQSTVKFDFVNHTVILCF